MATIINTSDDLLKLLSDNAEFYQAVRRLILTEELIQLPERFAAFANRVETFITKQEKFNEDQLQFNEEQRQFNDETRQFIDEQRQFNDEIRQFTDDQRRFNHRMEVNMGELKGNAARTIINAYLYEIAAHLNLTLQSTLSRRQLGELIGPPGHTPGVSNEDRMSFIRADLVAAGTDSQGVTRYIALEASYTADARDTRRARRNAELLERLIGCPAHPMIASVHNDRDIQSEIDDGAMAWYALNPDDFTPE